MGRAVLNRCWRITLRAYDWQGALCRTTDDFGCRARLLKGVFEMAIEQPAGGTIFVGSAVWGLAPSHFSLTFRPRGTMVMPTDPFKP